MARFRHAAVLVRKTGGEYIKGRWVSGIETRTPIQISVQHRESEGARDARLALPEGERQDSSVTIYTSTQLFGGGLPGIEADQIEDNGKRYEIKAVDLWKNGIRPHCKAMAAEVKE